ncbi:MAG: hypothetical protein KKC43_05720 [Alphaproteobacteria bacterium]|nr:hypothetical protein [Alphaproteobacteria bacterium]
MTSTILAHPAASDRQFFRACFTAMAFVLVSGFVVQLALGRSSFNAPLIVHLHAVVFMGWVGIVLAQSWLATGGNIAMHRQLGKLALVWAITMIVFGTLVTLAATQTGRTPFFFQPQHFLIANPMTLLGFAGLLIAAIALRQQTDWHARLQVGAFVMLMGPGFGRLIPMPLLTPYAFETAGLVALLVPAIGMLRDWRVHGRPHPAWLWGTGVLIAVMVLARMLAFSPVGAAIYESATAGSIVAGTDGLAFPPPPPGPM